MNKTLLLILCDFLLLTLLALTRWETAEPPRPREAPVPEMAANAVTKDQDLVAVMRQSFAEEQARRDELAEQLAQVQNNLASREQSLTQLEAERARLAAERAAATASLTEAQRTAAELGRKVEAVTQESTMTQQQLAQLQRELAEKQAEAERQARALAALERQHADARKQIEGLTLAVVVAEQEKKNLRETADTLRGQVESERTERLKVQEANTQLAQGVGQLAEKSSELTREIRENRPVNANVLFNEYLSNRVTAAFTGARRGLLGSSQRAAEANTVLVTDGGQVFALLHAADTLFPLGEYGAEWESLAVRLSHGGSSGAAASVNFLAQDPRIVVLPVSAEQAASLGAKVYALATDPFKFPEAVLIDGGGRGYGEVGFKLDPNDPSYVRVDNRIFRRLFGDFSPKRGDLVFAKTGELLGIMVNNEYCAVLKGFTAARRIEAGADIRTQDTSALLESLGARIRAMPQRLQ